MGFQYHREKEYKAEALDAQLQLVNLHILDELDEGKHVDGQQSPFPESKNKCD